MKRFKNWKSNIKHHIQKADKKEDQKEKNIDHRRAVKMAYHTPLDNNSTKQIKATFFESYFYVKQCIKAAFILFIGAIPEDFVMNIARNISANYRSAPQELYISQSSMNFWRLVAAGVFLYALYLVVNKIEWIPCKHLGYIKRAKYVEHKRILKLRIQAAKQTLKYNKAKSEKPTFHIFNNSDTDHKNKGDQQ